MKKSLFISTAFILCIASCTNESSNLGEAKLLREEVKEPGEEKLDGITLGKQEWSMRNLSVTHFKNGVEIPQAKSEKEWIKACSEKKPAWCYYDFKPEHGNAYGRLYNWYAVTDTSGLAPDGWHIPNDKEFEELAQTYGGSDVAGHALKSTIAWHGDANGNGNNASGFNAQPGGYANEDGDGWDIYLTTYFWSTDADNDSTGSAACLYANELDDDLKITGPEKSIHILKTPKTHGHYVRCVKNK